MSNDLFQPAEPEVVELSGMARRFAEEYLIDFKAGPAALRAGYARAQTGYDLLQDPRIDALIREGKRRSSQRVDISIDMVLENFRLMTVVNASDFFYDCPIMVDVPGGLPKPTGKTYLALKPLSEWTDAMKFALKSIKYTANGPEVVLHDKSATNERLGKHLGMFVERKEVSGPGGGPIELITSDMDAKQAAEAYAASLGATE